MRTSGPETNCIPSRLSRSAPLLGAVLLMAWCAGLAGSARAAVVFDSAASNSANAGSCSWSHTVSGSNRLLIVGVAIRGGIPVSSVTYAGQSLTFIRYDMLNTWQDVRSELWYRVNPALGTGTVTVNLSSSQNMVCGSSSWTGVNQSTPLGSSGGGTHAGGSAETTATASLSTSSGQVVVDVCAAQASWVTLTPDSAQTQVWNLPGYAGAGAASYKSAGASGTSMSWTLSPAEYWTLSAVAVNPLLTTPTFTATRTHTRTPTRTHTPTHTRTASPTFTRTPTATRTHTPTPTPTHSPTGTPTHTRTHTRTATPTFTASPTYTVTPTRTNTPYYSPTVTPTRTPTSTRTPSFTATPTRTHSATISPTATVTPPYTRTPSPSVTPTPTVSPTRTHTDTATPTRTRTATRTITATRTTTPTVTVTQTATVTPSVTLTSTVTPTSTISATYTVSPTVTPTPTVTLTPLPLDVTQVLPYPQPAKEVLWLAFPGRNAERVRVEVFNVVGERVNDFQVDAPSVNRVSWDTREVAPGVYLVRLTVTADGADTRHPLVRVVIVR